MKRFILGAVGLLLPLAIAASPADAQAARHYDCSKAGNANKAVCKGATPAAKPAVAAKPAPKPTTAARNYDCSKAGNANKAVCKSAAPVPAPMKTPVATTSTRHYDCSKAGNANKTACKGTTPVAVSPPAQHSAPAPAATHSVSVGQNTNPSGPGGATAKCKDGTYSMSKHRSGTCSRHQGVAQFY